MTAEWKVADWAGRLSFLRGSAPRVVTMPSFDRSSLRILITGASTGLGLALAERLLPGPHRLTLTAREPSLARFSAAGISEGPRVCICPLDITDGLQRTTAVDHAVARFGGIDVLVNNAGIAYRSVTEHVTTSDLLAQMDVNFRSPMELIRLVLPYMREQRWGRILNVSSVGGMMAMPTMGAYSASKFALEGMSEALWYEVRPWNIRVSLIQPGFINSDGFEKVRFTGLSAKGKDHQTDPYHSHYQAMSGFIGRVMRRVPATTDSVARTIERTIESEHPPLRVPATLDAHLFALLRRLLPRGLYHWVLFRSLPRIRVWGKPSVLPPPPTRPRQAEPTSAPTAPPAEPQQQALHAELKAERNDSP